jgi:NADPH:quinone reductase-like Zn-dependent oxidoreductase
MRAVRIHEFGGPERVQVEEVPVPEPRPGEALVRVHAAALNPVDWMIREHIYNPAGADRVPLTLGQDFAGVIVGMGPGTMPPFTVGTEVLGEAWGSFAEYVAVPSKDLVLKPETLDFVTAAAIPMPSLTAWQMVVDTAQATSEMRFLIHGAAGGVGSYAAQFARLKGAFVVATASAPSFEWLRRIGVNEIIDYQRQRFEDEVHDIDVVIDPIGGDVQARSWRVLKPGGLLINLIGEIDEQAAARAGVRAVAFEMHYDTEELRQIVELIEAGMIEPHVSKVLSLDEARRAMDLNQHGQSHGQIVLKVA